jgi:DHA1 family tetracycline resistance protein-like MFS transporter
MAGESQPGHSSGAGKEAVPSRDLTHRRSPLARVVPAYGVVAISYLGYAMMGTLFVPMLLSPTSTYVASDTSRAVRSLLIGVLLMLYPLAQVVGSPILGALSDRLGRRPILLASLVVTTAAYALIVLALAVQSLWLLGVALVICGFGEANAAITSSVVADVTDPEVRPKYLGYMFSVMSVSYVLGPLVGGALAASFGYVVPFGVVLVLLGLALVAVRWRFAETHQPDPASEPVPLSASFGNLKTVFTDRLLRRIYLINFLVFVAAMGFWRVITEYLVDVFHLTVGEVTMDYSVFAVTAGIGNLLILPRLLPHFGLRPLAATCIALGSVAMVAAVLPGPEWIPLAFGGLGSLALAMAFPTLGGMLSSLVGADRQGAVMGNNTALTFLGEAVGVLGGSALAGLKPALPLLVFAGLAAIALVLLITYRTAPLPDVR